MQCHFGNPILATQSVFQIHSCKETEQRNWYKEKKFLNTVNEGLSFTFLDF